MPSRARAHVFRVLLLTAALTGSAWLAATASGAVAGVPRPPRPPEQPAAGPGGAGFAYEGVSGTRTGRPPLGYWTFEPTRLRLDETVRDEALPVVVFLHGFTAVDPTIYRGWIDHIVRRGAIVIYPDYQDLNPFGDDWTTYEANAMAAVRAAMADLEARGARPDHDRVAVVGHSLGGVLAANYAATTAATALPVPAVLMVVQPGGCGGCEPLPEGEGVPLADLGTVWAETLALVVVGDDDEVVGDAGAKRIWFDLDGVPLDRRDYVTLVSDQRGLPFLRATHFLPQTAGFRSAVDALDWFGTWKLLDLLTDCAFAGRGCGTALNGSAIQRDMGVWSDGEPVRPATVTDAP